MAWKGTELVIRIAADLKKYRATLREAGRDTQQAMAQAKASTEGLTAAQRGLEGQAGRTAQQLVSAGRAAADGNYAQAGQQVAGMAAHMGTAAAGAGALGVVLGVAAAAVAGYVLVSFKASQEFERQANLMALTGNAAGLLAGDINAMARSSAEASHGTVGDAREIAEALVGTGKIGRTATESLTGAVERFAQASGQGRDQVTADFAKMADGVTKWATEHNRQYHFLNVAQLQYIKTLEDAGRKQEAMIVAGDAFKAHLAGIENNVGYLQSMWRALGRTASKAWDDMLNVGRAETTSSRLEDASKKVNAARSSLEYMKAHGKSETEMAGPANTLKKALEAQSVAQSDIRLMRQSADAQAEAAAATDRQTEAMGKWDDMAKRNRSSAKELADALAEVKKTGEAAGKSQAEIAAMQEQVRKSMESGSKGKSDAQKKEAQAAKTEFEFQNMVAKKNLEWAAEDEKARLARLAGLDKEAEAQAKVYTDSAASAQQRVDQLEQEAAAVAYAAEHQVSLAVAVERTTIARLEEAKAAAFYNNDGAAVRAIEAEIAARKRAIDLIGSKEGRDAADQQEKKDKETRDKFREDELKAWDKTNEQIGQSFIDAMMDSGRTAMGSLKAMFRTLVLNPVVNPIRNAVGGALSGAPQADGSFSTSVAAQVLGIGSTFGTGVAAGFANALGGTFAGSLTAAGSLIGTGTVAGVSSGIGMAIGTIAPYLAAIAAIYMALTAKTPGEQHTGGYYSTAGNTGLAGAGAITGDLGTGGQSRDLIDRNNPALQSAVENGANALVTSVTAMAASLGKDLALALDLGFAANTNGQAANKNAFGYFGVSLNGQMVDTYQNRDMGEDAAKAFEQLMKDAGAAMAELVLAGTDFGKDGETALDTLTRLSSSLQTVNAVFDTLGTTAYQVSLAGGDMASQLADLFGGLEGFTQSAGAYYQAYYSEAERAATSTRLVSEALGKLGLELPGSRDGFRALVEAQDLTTEAGRSTYAALLGLAPAFAELTQVMERLGSAVAEEVQRLRGLLVTESSGGLVAMQAQFATTTAQARAGDSSALERLPELSHAIEAAAALQAVTAADLAVMRGQLAASLSDTMAMLGLQVPALATGTNLVPHDMLVMAHKGEAVVPAAFNPAAGGVAPGGAGVGSSAQLQALLTELVGLRDEVRADVGHNAKTARILSRLSQDGEALAVDATVDGGAL